MKSKSAQGRQIAKLIDYKTVFGSAQGKRVLYDMMKAAHMLETSFVKKDSHEMAFREGERNNVIRILAILKMDPEKLRQMIQEGEEENE